MDCTDFLARYSEYDDSLVASVEVDRFRSHMESCASCARYDRVLRKGRMVARQAPVEPADDFLSRLDGRLRREASRPRRRAPGRSARVTAALAALAILLSASASVGLLADRTGASVTGSVDVRGAAADPASEAREPGPTAARSALRSLPRLAHSSDRHWATERVARGTSSTYSPLVVGPPAYRATGTPTLHPLE